jgi:hypothetical protein
MYLPAWAVSAFGVVFFAVAALAGWALRHVGGKVQDDLHGVKLVVDKIDDKVDIIDKRVVRVETILNGSSGSLMRHTPPAGVPVLSDPG